MTERRSGSEEQGERDVVYVGDGGGNELGGVFCVGWVGEVVGCQDGRVAG